LAFRFSFKHLQADHARFGIANCSREFFCGFLEKLRIYSAGSVDELLDQNNKEHRHVIDFEATSEKDGFMGAPAGLKHGGSRLKDASRLFVCD